MRPENFKDSEPKLVLFDYFKGKTSAWGIFEDRFGNVRRQFQVDIEGQVKGNEITLDERFQYDDGEKDQRIWQIRKTGDHTFEGTADDVIGIAKGTVQGNALNWTYDLNLKVGDTSYKVHFDDWMFLQPGGVMINRAQLSKWGVDIGEVTLFFKKPLSDAE
jgi:hypothetical protein|tara:strand:- start:146 stop:628 length:483 start_codon:yes stop_codon:yes gene_type:complete